MHKNKTYIIAEVGINHNGSLENCFALIKAAAEAGCDCVKFQLFRTKMLYPLSAGKLGWRDAEKEYNYDIYSAVESFELPVKWIPELMRYCKKRKIDFLSSVFDKQNAEFLVRQGIKMIKIASSAITNIPLIEYCARYKLPMIMSTGGATLGEIEEAVETVNRYHNKLALLHCVLSYPIELNKCNLGIIETLRYAFPNNQIGYSDHTKEISTAAVQAVYLGARIIEKHITLDKRMKGPDHYFALEPQELKGMVEDIRRAQKKAIQGDIRIDKKIYGSSKKKVLQYEHYLRDFCFVTIFAEKDIRKEQRIKIEDLCILRPGKKKRGLDPKYLNLFKEFKIYAAKDIGKDEVISWEKIFNA